MQFETKEDGNIGVSPLTGYLTMTVAGTALALRLEFVHSQAQLETEDRESVQLVLSAVQARALGAALQSGAELLSRPPENAVRQ